MLYAHPKQNVFPTHRERKNYTINTGLRQGEIILCRPESSSRKEQLGVLMIQWCSPVFDGQLRDQSLISTHTTRKLPTLSQKNTYTGNIHFDLG